MSGDTAVSQALDEMAANKRAETGKPPADEEQLKRRVEAVLFMSPQPVSPARIAAVLGTGAVAHVKKCADKLCGEYALRDSAVEIVCESGMYHMRLRSQFSDIAAKTSQHTDLTKKELKVLAYIAKKEGDTGVMQSQVVKALGTTIYDSIRSLEEKRFINSKKKGRSRILNTTAKFREYFRVEGI